MGNVVSNHTPLILGEEEALLLLTNKILHPQLQRVWDAAVHNTVPAAFFWLAEQIGRLFRHPVFRSGISGALIGYRVGAMVPYGAIVGPIAGGIIGVLIAFFGRAGSWSGSGSCWESAPSSSWSRMGGLVVATFVVRFCV